MGQECAAETEIGNWGSLRVSKLALDVLNMHGVMVSDFFIDPQLSEFGFRRTHP